DHRRDVQNAVIRERSFRHSRESRCYPPSDMPRLRILIPAALALVVIGIVATTVVAARVRARQRADWFEGKNLTLAPIVKGLKEPTWVVGPPDGSNRLFVLERAGRIKVADAHGNLRPTPFLDVSQDTSTGNEEGLLGLAFHPA